jgi:ribosomal protein L21E
VTLAPELTEAIKEPADRQRLPLDDWIVAAAEPKFRADDEAAIFEEAERKRRAAALQEYLDEYQAGSRVPLAAVIAGHPGGGPGRPAGSPVMPRFPGAAGRLFP